MDQPQEKNQDNNQDQNQGKLPGQTGEPEAHQPAAEASAAGDTMKDLPEVEAPSLDGAEAAEPAAEPTAEPAHAHAAAPMLVSASDAVSDIAEQVPVVDLAAATQPRSFRFALLAAAIALAAGFGAFVGALSASGIARHDVADAAAPRSADTRGVLQGLKAELAELNALKASLDAANRGATAQFAKISDRLVNLERLQADKRAAAAPAAPEITGSIAKPAEPAPAAAPTPAAATILNDWIVRDVRNGRALVESRYGGIFVVASGGSVPGLGRVESVRRQDGAWIVVTARGTITSER
jgi:hypothetical protein